MKVGLLRCFSVGSCSYALAQSSSGSSAHHPPGRAGPPSPHARRVAQSAGREDHRGQNVECPEPRHDR
jgi:hypothetical protein